MTTLLALYRRPDGGPDALATFLIVEVVPEMIVAPSQPVDTVGSSVEDRT